MLKIVGVSMAVALVVALAVTLINNHGHLPSFFMPDAAPPSSK